MAAENSLLGSQLEGEKMENEEVTKLGVQPSSIILSTPTSKPPLEITSIASTLKTGILNIKVLQQAGKKLKAEAHQYFQNEVDHIIMQLICVQGLVSNLLDPPEWKELMHKLNGLYHLSNSDDFSEWFIPQEAAYIHQKQIDLLKQEHNLTLTFDGTTIHKSQSFYTAHATTSSWSTYFVDGHEGTGEHHDKVWVMDKLLLVRLFNDLSCLINIV